MKRGSAFDCSLRVLALREHSEAELRRKLKEKGYDEEGIEGSIARLKELGYLDDARFARSFAGSAIRNGRGYGVRLKLELARRGVAAETVRETLAELAQEYGEAEVLAELMGRRFAGFDPATASDKEKRKVVGYLQRKGFSLSAILARLNTHSTF
ncbi:MAG TPA: regulatory protein RecX [Geomonas sp.]